MAATKFKGKNRKLKTLAQLKKVCPEAFEAECEHDTGGQPATFVLCDGFLFCFVSDYNDFVGAWDGEGFDEVWPDMFGFDPNTEEGEEAYDELMSRAYSLAG